VNPRTAARIHYAVAGAWALMLIPTLIWWKDSVLWVAAMSLYANFSSHLSAAKASKAEEAAQDHDESRTP
jgi:hypothetical protein